jgi:hypothetical protein
MELKVGIWWSAVNGGAARVLGAEGRLGVGVGAGGGSGGEVDVGLSVDPVASLTGALGITVGVALIEPVLRPKLFEFAGELDEGSEAGTRPLPTPAPAQRPWH